MPKIFNDKDKNKIRKNLIAQGLISLEKKGYKATSIEDIARSAGIAKGTFYNFYPSKEYFFYEVMLSIRDKNREELYKLFSTESKIDRNSVAEYLYKQYTINKSIYHYFSVDELNIIFRKIPDKLAETKIDSSSLAVELFAKIPNINPRFNTSVVVNMMHLLGTFSAHHEALGYDSYKETVRLMANSLADYVFGIAHNE